jgi:hypothetical protein
MGEVMGEIVKISYNTGDKFYVKLRDPNTAEEVDVVATDVFNQLAVDAAFVRRAPVILELDGNRIRRVQSDLPRDETEIAVPGGGIITRISTQVQEGGYVAEILYAQPPSTVEAQVLTKDPVMHMLCHGAYLSKHWLVLTLDEARLYITGVIKERLPFPP